MLAFSTLLAAASPEPTPSMTVDPESVTPGAPGFLVIVIIVIAVFLLVWDMQRRIRRTRYRAEVAEQLDAEELALENEAEAAAEATESDSSAPQSDDGRTTT